MTDNLLFLMLNRNIELSVIRQPITGNLKKLNDNSIIICSFYLLLMMQLMLRHPTEG